MLLTQTDRNNRVMQAVERRGAGQRRFRTIFELCNPLRSFLFARTISAAFEAEMRASSTRNRRFSSCKNPFTTTAHFVLQSCAVKRAGKGSWNRGGDVKEEGGGSERNGSKRKVMELTDMNERRGSGRRGRAD